MDNILNTVENIDINLFLYLNQHNNAWLDFVMYWISYKWTWVPLYLFIAAVIFKKFNLKQAVLVMLAVMLLVTAADRISTGILKPYFKRHRPAHNPELKDQVHTVNGYRGSAYGFVSSHAANTFAVAVFLCLLFGSKYWRWLFLWAALNCYSRIYLGLHFPLDILFGGALGAILALLIYRLYGFVQGKFFPVKTSGF